MIEISYDKCNVPKRIDITLRKYCGDDFVNDLLKSASIPQDVSSSEENSIISYHFMKELEKHLPQSKIQNIMREIKHDLNESDFKWAIEMFNNCNNDIDSFAETLQKMQIDQIRKCYIKGIPFYGVSVNDKVMQYVDNEPDIFYGKRHGDKIIAKAIPYDLGKYIDENNDLMKRYYACHCRYVRESILHPERQVSGLFCHCSLGHTMVLWVSVLKKKLTGKVIKSILNGYDECVFQIDI